MHPCYLYWYVQYKKYQRYVLNYEYVLCHMSHGVGVAHDTLYTVRYMIRVPGSICTWDIRNLS